MLSIRLAAVLLALGALPSFAQAQGCPFTSIATSDFGIGTGFLAAPFLKVDLDAANCSLPMSTTAPACCNTFFTEQFLAVGVGTFPSGLPLPEPLFMPGSLLYVDPFDILGPHPPGDFIVPLPPVPGLIGVPIHVQAIPVFFTTIGFTTEFGVSQAVTFTLS